MQPKPPKKLREWQALGTRRGRPWDGDGRAEGSPGGRYGGTRQAPDNSPARTFVGSVAYRSSETFAGHVTLQNARLAREFREKTFWGCGFSAAAKLSRGWFLRRLYIS